MSKTPLPPPKSLATLASEARGCDGGLGMACPKCGCLRFATADTVRLDGAVRRYHSCRNCGYRMRTVERPG